MTTFAEPYLRWRCHLLPLLIFTLAAIILTYPLAFNMGFAVVDDADPLLNAWILAWDAHILPRNPLALYHANDFYPYSNTLAYSETLLGLAIFTTPLIWLTDNPILAVNLATLASYALSGIGMYALTYRFTRRRGAALVAGMIFAFNPFRFAHIEHVQLLSAQWTPFTLLFMDRLIHRPTWRNAFGLLLFFNMQLLSCYYYALFLAVALAVLGLGYLLAERRCFTRRLLGWLALCSVVTLAIQIPLSLPYFRVAESMGFERTIETAARGGADLADFVTAPPTNRLYGAATASLRGEQWWEHVTFPGLTATLLALIGAARPPAASRRARWLYLALALTMGVLSLGPALYLDGRVFFAPLPYHLLFAYVPGFTAIRQPARFHMFTMVGLSLLAGLGAQTLTRRIATRWQRALPVVCLAFMAAENLYMPLALTPVPRPAAIPPVYTWLADEAEPGPVLELPILMDVGSVESPRLYYSTRHWRRLINGYGGFFPPTYAYFLFFDREFPKQPYDWIVGLGVRYVILHRWQYPADELARMDADLRDFAGLRLVAEFADDQVYEVVHPNTGYPNTPRTDVTWERRIRLLGFVFKPSSPCPGDTLELKLFWQNVSPMTGDASPIDYTVFVHVLDAAGALVTQHDGQPQDGAHPTSAWRYEEVVMETRPLTLPADLPPGLYTVRVGFYDLATMQRLEVLSIDGKITGDALTLAEFTISPE